VQVLIARPEHHRHPARADLLLEHIPSDAATHSQTAQRV
jgi:hypothetical protein